MIVGLRVFLFLFIVFFVFSWILRREAVVVAGLSLEVRRHHVALIVWGIPVCKIPLLEVGHICIVSIVEIHSYIRIVPLERVLIVTIAFIVLFVVFVYIVFIIFILFILFILFLLFVPFIFISDWSLFFLSLGFAFSLFLSRQV